MRRALIKILTSGLLALACSGSDDCDDALDKLSECNLRTDFAGVDFDDSDCDGRTQCIANCVKDASCAELNATEASSPYRACLAGCG